MRIAMVGLGRMGGNIARRLVRNGHEVIGYNRSNTATDEMARVDHIIAAHSIGEVVSLLPNPKIVWFMVPAGAPTEEMIIQFAKVLSPGDILIDGGNSNFSDSIRRAKYLAEYKINFLDIGVSGGIWGLDEGYSLMIGGDKKIAAQLTPIFQTLAPSPDRGWGHVGPHGAGHYVKMVHNGIEYGMMEAIAEGFEIMRSRTEFELDLHQVSQIWQHGSVVRSWLLDLTEEALKEDQNLETIKDWVADTGEGRWTVFEAINQDIPAPVITLSLMRRFESRQKESYSAKLLAAMRNQFGGHPVQKTDE